MVDLFAIYVHWPFCKAKCPYCDFNSHVSDSIDHAQWLEAYLKEINFIAEKIKDRSVTSIFFGGGTPSLMEPSTVEGIINHIQTRWKVANDVEITLEANPTSIEAQKFEDFKAAGINRVSIGVQSLRDDDLKFLGREHSAVEAIEAVKTGNRIFDRVSFDLMYARPEQTISDWREELAEALTYASGHLSLYQLTIEPGTPFYIQHARGDFRVPEADQGGEFYEVTQEVLGQANMPAYEISNHAKAGQESVHNLAYWQYADYVGVGPGAHGRLTIDGKKFATRTHRAPDIYLQKVAENAHAYQPFEEISKEDQLTEKIMMGLRLKEGIAFNDHEIEKLDSQKLNYLIEEGFLKKTGTYLKPTRAGMQRLNGVLTYLL
jgi:oxygen-independent coproporphyrinogen-3 oxidase